MKWMNILKRKEENYGKFLSELKRLEKEKDRKVQELLDKVKRERPRNPLLNEEEMEEWDRIAIPLAEYKEANKEFVERKRREERSAGSIEANRRYYERLRNEQKSRMSGRNFKIQGKKGGRKKKKKRKGEFKVQRGSGQSKSQRRSGGRDDSRRFRKL